MDRFAKSSPDRKFEGDTADDDLFDATADEVDRLDGENTRYRQSAERMNTLFNGDGRAAGLVRAWGEGADPIMYLVENFGDDFVEAMQSEEGKERFKEARDKWLESKTQDDQAQARFDSNFSASMDALTKVAGEYGLDDQAAADLFLSLHEMVEQALDGTYTEDMFRLAYKGGMYDRDVEVARREGEVKGRNANIRRRLKEEETGEGDIPTLPGGGGSYGEEAPEERPSSVGFLGNIPIPRRGKGRK